MYRSSSVTSLIIIIAAAVAAARIVHPVFVVAYLRLLLPQGFTGQSQSVIAVAVAATTRTRTLPVIIIMSSTVRTKKRDSPGDGIYIFVSDYTVPYTTMYIQYCSYKYYDKQFPWVVVVRMIITTIQNEEES